MSYAGFAEEETEAPEGEAPIRSLPGSAEGSWGWDESPPVQPPCPCFPPAWPSCPPRSDVQTSFLHSFFSVSFFFFLIAVNFTT